MNDPVSTWDLYARFFVLEEGTVYPQDRDEMEFYRRLRLRMGPDCLELGAGAGRLARSLIHPSGMTVGLEPSRGMLALWTAEGSRLATRIRGVAQRLPFRDRSFDLVVFPYNGLQCILGRRERLAVLHEAARVLRRRGGFVLETCPLFSTRPLERNAHRYTFVNDEITLTLVETISRDLARGVTRYDMLYSVEGEPDTRVVLDVAIIEPDDLVRELRSAGFEVDHTWGDYDESSYRRGLSPRFLVQASRADAAPKGSN